MMSKQMIYVALVIVMLTACMSTASPTTPTSTPSISFSGRLLFYDQRGIYILIRNSVGGEVEEVQIVLDEVIEESISPDKRYLLYTTESKTKLLDLSTYEVKTLFEFEPLGMTIMESAVSCLNWSPNSNELSYRYQNKLFVFDINTSTSRLIVEAPWRNYSPSGLTDGHPYYGFLGCGNWSNAGSLLFQRYTGQMPSSITTDTGVIPELVANTTSLATIYKDAINLTDAPRMLHINIMGMSQNGDQVVFEEDNNLYLTKSFTSFVDIQPLRIALSCPCVKVDFTSDDSKLIVNTKSDIYLVNRKTLEVQLMSTLPENWPVYGRIWLESPEQGLTVFAESRDVLLDSGTYVSKQFIVVGDLSEKRTFDLREVYESRALRLIAWLPN